MVGPRPAVVLINAQGARKSVWRRPRSTLSASTGSELFLGFSRRRYPREKIISVACATLRACSRVMADAWMVIQNAMTDTRGAPVGARPSSDAGARVAFAA